MLKNLVLAAALLLLPVYAAFAESEKLPMQIGDGDDLSFLSWSPNDDLILTATREFSSLRLWNRASGRVIWKTNAGFIEGDAGNYAVERAAWTKNQKFFLTGTDSGKIQLWETATGKLV